MVLDFILGVLDLSFSSMAIKCLKELGNISAFLCLLGWIACNKIFSKLSFVWYNYKVIVLQSLNLRMAAENSAYELTMGNLLRIVKEQ